MGLPVHRHLRCPSPVEETPSNSAWVAEVRSRSPTGFTHVQDGTSAVSVASPPTTRANAIANECAQHNELGTDNNNLRSSRETNSGVGKGCHGNDEAETDRNAGSESGLVSPLIRRIAYTTMSAALAQKTTLDTTIAQPPNQPVRGPMTRDAHERRACVGVGLVERPVSEGDEQCGYY